MSINIAWLSRLKSSLQRNDKDVQSKWLQLATIRTDGQMPAVRSVVFRGLFVTPNGEQALRFVTDRRSDKVEQVQKNNWAEACWYFPVTREQYRVLGSLEMIMRPVQKFDHAGKHGSENGNENENTSGVWRFHDGKFHVVSNTYSDLYYNAWEELSDAARLQFFSPYTPGLAPPESDLRSRFGSIHHEDTKQQRELQQDYDLAKPADEFVVLLLVPHQVDHLELKPDQPYFPNQPHNRTMYRKSNDEWTSEVVIA